jgi:N-acetylglucosaminyl-diphospho-decaprenol L-rhamnosyltransferase
MSEPAASIAVVVPNHDGVALLPRCLAALAAQTRRADLVIVADDGSRDASRNYLAQQHPAVEVVALPANRGFCAAANAGMRRALERGAELVVLLNNDAFAQPPFLAALEAAALRHPEADAFAACLLTPESPATIDSAGLALADGFHQVSRGGGSPFAPPYDADAEVLGACGGAAAYRASYLADVGFFDERFFAYFEDYDLALRGILRGKRTHYVAGARAVHLGSATLGRHSRRGTFLYARNGLHLLGRTIPFGLLVAQTPALVASRLRLLALAARRGVLLPALLGLITGKARLLAALASRLVRGGGAAPGSAQRLAAFLRAGAIERRAGKARAAR